VTIAGLDAHEEGTEQARGSKRMQQQTVTLIVAVAGIAGTFGSGFFSQRMARKSQCEQWILDQRKEE
jgi:hypothetical protein